MTSRQSERYGPMLFDASDVTTLKRRIGFGNQADKQVAGSLKPTDVLSPSQLLSAAVGAVYCNTANNLYCTLPVRLVGILSPTGGATPISLPS